MKVSVEFTTGFHNMASFVGLYSIMFFINSILDTEFYLLYTLILNRHSFKVHLDAGVIKGFTDNGITKFLGVPYASIPS